MNHAGRNCRDLVAAISDYIDGDLTPARCRDLESHLHQCPCCDRFADSLKRAVAVCRSAGETRLPAAVQRRARARVAALLKELPSSTGPATSVPGVRSRARESASRRSPARPGPARRPSR